MRKEFNMTLNIKKEINIKTNKRSEPSEVYESVLFLRQLSIGKICSRKRSEHHYVSRWKLLSCTCLKRGCLALTTFFQFLFYHFLDGTPHFPSLLLPFQWQIFFHERLFSSTHFILLFLWIDVFSFLGYSFLDAILHFPSRSLSVQCKISFHNRLFSLNYFLPSCFDLTCFPVPLQNN